MKEGNIVKKVIPIGIIAVLSATAIFLGIAFLAGNKDDSGNNATQSASTDSNSVQSETEDDNTTVSAGTTQTSEFLTLKTKDTTAEFDESEAIYISLNGSSISGEGEGYTIDGSVITITAEGIYVFEGTLDDGSIVVNAPDTDDVRLVLNGVDITSTTTAPINIIQADKVIITLVDGTDNSITDNQAATEEADSDDDLPNAAIYSKEDLSINGNGTLVVNANYNNGITGKDDVIIAGGNITITAVNNGLKGKDSVNITAGTLTITAGGDGIKTTNSEDSTKGYIHITGGTIDITSDGDGIQGQNTVFVEDGTININAGGGSSNAAAHSESMGGFGGFGDFDDAESDTDDSTSTKGIKTVTDLIVSGGTITIDSADDTIHSDDNLTVNGGTLDLTAGDDGMHSDTSITVNGGSITINTCYEAIESAAITVNDGTINMTATDDGFNATSGSSTGGMGGMDSSDGSTLTINGGQIYLNAAGDGLDSNGTVVMTGGVVVVDGPENSGNGAIDYAGSFEISGGYLVAAGASGMAQSVSSATDICAVSITLDSTQSADTLFTITDEDGNVILSITPQKTWQTIVVASPDLKSGSTYNYYTGGKLSGSSEQGCGIYTGGTITDADEAGSYTQDSTNTSVGSGNTMGGGQGGFGGDNFQGGGQGGFGGGNRGGGMQ